MLGRFLHSLNKFCLEEYGMRYDVTDYHVYDFAKAGGGRCCARFLHPAARQGQQARSALPLARPACQKQMARCRRRRRLILPPGRQQLQLVAAVRSLPQRLVRLQIWQCAQDESNHKVHEFFKSHHFAAGIETIPGARPPGSQRAWTAAPRGAGPGPAAGEVGCARPSMAT